MKDEKWEERLDSIVMSLFVLKASQYLFREVEKIISANSDLREDKYFVGWVRENYFAASAMGVRRQVDEHPDCISLIKLLKRIKENPTVLSRERYHSLSTIKVAYGDPGLAIDWAFSELVGEGRDFVDPSDIEKDIAELDASTKSILDYADKIVAHFDKKSLSHEYPLEPKELDMAIEVIERILNKYHELVTGSGIGFNPVPSAPWKSVFRFPWLPMDEKKVDGQ